MTALRVVFLVIHIIAAGLWISSAVTEFIFGRLIKSNQGKPSEYFLMNATVRYLGVAGSMAGILILLTGLGLAGISRFGILGIGGSITPTWLFIKQIVYIILLVIVFTAVQPASKRLGQQFAASGDGTQTVTAEMRGLYQRIITLGNLHNLLVLVNIILAVWKPS